MNPSAIFDEFPAPEYRGNQKQALADIQRAFQSGADIVLVQAPTGSGKSLLARAIAGCARTKDDASSDRPYDAFYTTPQVSQLDDVADDDLLEDLSIVRGKNNYSCILPGQTDVPVNEAKCIREAGFECDIKNRCPYFTDRADAANNRIAAMTLAYFMQTANSNIFDQRDVVVIDEAHGLGTWAEMHGTIELSPRTVPWWNNIDIPPVDRLEEAVEFCRWLYELSGRRLEELPAGKGLTKEQAAERERIYRLRGNISWLITDNEGTSQTDGDEEWVADQSNDTGHITIKPLNPERYLKNTVWDRGEKFALLSATILNQKAFCAKMGLSEDDVAFVRVPHTFPVENRPLYDVTQGKMTYEERDDTLPKIASTIAQVMSQHKGEKGLVHCHSYAIQEKLADLLAGMGVGGRLRDHSSNNRDQKLDDWKRANDDSVFLSVKMEEALDLRGDLARWQVICKAPYLNTRDSRVNTRLENGRWGWYYRAALETIIQACGRVVRTPDDYGATYLADDSILDIFDKASTDIPPWFQDQIDRMTTPTLPPAPTV